MPALTPVSKQVTGEEAKTALLAWAAESLSAQERRFVKLEQAFKEAELDTSGLRKYDLSKRPGTSYQASLEVSLLFFLRGPKSEYDRRNMKRWRDDSINVLVQKGACQRGLRVCRSSHANIAQQLALCCTPRRRAESARRRLRARAR